ncbi:MAG: alpha-galactosidase [Planctomycetes bacterium]|nr:alpha-galactosidase [Planctomycetota bacterium]
MHVSVAIALALLLSGSPVSAQTHPVQSADDITRYTGDFLVEPVSPAATVYARTNGLELYLDNGLIRRTFRLTPNAATVALDNLATNETLLRAVRPEAEVTINGTRYAVGGLTGQPNHAYLTDDWLAHMTADPEAMRFVGYEVGRPEARLDWKRARHCSPTAVWPPQGVHLRMDYQIPSTDESADAGVGISVHYEMYDGVPVLSKWFTVTNETEQPITVDSFTAEILAVVEQESWVGVRQASDYPVPQCLHIETDYSFGGMTPATASSRAVHWVADPQYSSQVNYQRIMPCLLRVEPELGPGQIVEPGTQFESFRVFELVYDTSDRERRGLALRRMYRTIAPWVTENPLMHHMRVADPAEVRRAIDQAAEVGFEMVILSFGSGFNIESRDPAVIAQWAELAAYARNKGIDLGGYSLLASRRISDTHDVVMPEGVQPMFGNSPCIGSEWGINYFNTLHEFFESTGYTILEHDGSYPGDECTSELHPGHIGHADSRWNQWRTITDFYKWCRSRGISLNVPDYYYLSGSTKNGMGYREVNWSLPRAQQVIHTRQNIYDGTWTKTPSMGWMFVPLTEYHGGGAAATIEPLDAHLDHYQRMMRSNLALGVQACYRGPRLFDTQRTREMVTREVSWYKRYREILESDIVHGRRADGRHVDWMLHVNPFPSTPEQPRGMLVAFNPLTQPVTTTLHVNLYYTGLKDTAHISIEGHEPTEAVLSRDYTVDIEMTVPAEGMTWATISE